MRNMQICFFSTPELGKELQAKARKEGVAVSVLLWKLIWWYLRQDKEASADFAADIHNDLAKYKRWLKKNGPPRAADGRWETGQEEIDIR